MGALADVTSEFKQGGAKEKTLIIIGVVAVAGVAYYIYRYKQQTASQQGVSPGGSPGGQVAGYPMAGNVPVIPGGVNPLYDPSGNLVAFQNPLVNTGLIPGQTPRSYTSILGTLAPNTQIRTGGPDANGERFWIGQTGNAPEQLFYAPLNSTIQYGPLGRVWLSPSGNQANHVLLTKGN